jgi:hypothetical protein
MSHERKILAYKFIQQDWFKMSLSTFSYNQTVTTSISYTNYAVAEMLYWPTELVFSNNPWFTT